MSNEAQKSEQSGFPKLLKKPIEIYAFIDPTCPKCWSLEPYIKKLSIEYGRFFTIRPIINSHTSTLKDQFDPSKKRHDNCIPMPKLVDKDPSKTRTEKGPIAFPLITSIAVKAAELQGKNAGRAFLRAVQEGYFLKKQNISDETVLIQCAGESNIDVQEFKNDLYSNLAKKAFQCDLKIKTEMEVDDSPTLVFFNQKIEEEGIKVSGLYPYSIYVHVLSKMLQFKPIPTELPPLEDFLAYYKVISNKEVAIIYDWTLAETNREMKKLKLKQKVTKNNIKHGSFWKCI